MIKIEITIPMAMDEKQCQMLTETAHYLLAVVSDSKLKLNKPIVTNESRIGQYDVLDLGSATLETIIPPEPKIPIDTSASMKLDSTGTTWNAEIHSKTQSKNADGTWKYKRGYQPCSNAVPIRLPSIAPTSGIPLPPMNPSQPDVIPAPPATIDNFPDFMVNITDLIASGKLNRSHVLEAVKSVGLESLPVVATRADLIPAINEAINKMVVG